MSLPNNPSAPVPTAAAEIQPQIAGLCWIQEADWDRLKEVAEDRERLEATWQEWEAKSLEMIEVFATRNIHIQKIDVNIEELINWCASQDKPINASTRAEYVTQVMLEQKRLNTSQVTKH